MDFQFDKEFQRKKKNWKLLQVLDMSFQKRLAMKGKKLGGKYDPTP